MADLPKNAQNKNKKAKEVHTAPVRFFLSVCEFISILSVPLLHVFLRPRLIYPEGYKKVPKIPRGALIIVNHQSRLDPFFAVYHTGFRNVFRNLPLYFPVTSEYMRNLLFKFPMYCLGCFDVGTTLTERAAGLLRIRSILHEGRTVVIFPEGKITKDKEVPDEFKKGINFLIGDTTPVMLIRLYGMSSWSFFNFTKRYQTQARFSELLPPGMSADEKFEKIRDFFGREESI